VTEFVPLSGLAASYSLASASWAAQAVPVYGRLATELVARVPGGVAGKVALDLGAGTGAASHALVEAGAGSVIAVDAAMGMLEHDRDRRPPAVVGDATRLPLADRSVDVVVAAYCLNHLSAPEAAMAEIVRVLRPGGSFVVSAYAHDDVHPVKAAVEDACVGFGWQPPDWYVAMRDRAAPLLATEESALAVVRRAGLSDAWVDRMELAFPELGSDELVAWRLGMAQVADFVASLDWASCERLYLDAAFRMTDCPTLVRRSIVVTWRRPA
jgi:SAM-dependent methyltransferase